MNQALAAILQRRAIKVFRPVEIPDAPRRDPRRGRIAPSRFNKQPCRFYGVRTPAMRKTAAALCMGQLPAETASALIVAVADRGSWRSTTQAHLEWVRTAGVRRKQVSEYENKSKLAKRSFIQGWFGTLGALKWVLFRLLSFWKTIRMPPVSREGLFKWAVKSTFLACEDLMIATEALGLNTCPREGFDGRRLSKFLGLSPRHHEIVMVIAIGKKSSRHIDPPQWRRPLQATVTVL